MKSKIKIVNSLSNEVIKFDIINDLRVGRAAIYDEVMLEADDKVSFAFAGETFLIEIDSPWQTIFHLKMEGHFTKAEYQISNNNKIHTRLWFQPQSIELVPYDTINDAYDRAMAIIGRK